ncbi:MAG: AraC family transcriptional regulator, partial [Alistipes sp.]
AASAAVVKRQGYVSRGVFSLYDCLSERQVCIPAGHVYMLAPCENIVEALPDELGLFEQTVIRFSLDDLKSIIMGVGVGSGQHSVVDYIARVMRCIYMIKPADDSIRHLFPSHDKDEATGTVDDYLRISLVVCFLTRDDENVVRFEISDNASLDITRFESAVYGNIYTNLSLEEISSKLCLSISSFKRKFRRSFHCPPHKWFLEKRMARARGMVLATDMSISQIGQVCGFTNQSHFIKLFKRFFGSTPTVYRREHCGAHPGSAGYKVKIEAEV